MIKRKFLEYKDKFKKFKEKNKEKNKVELKSYKEGIKANLKDYKKEFKKSWEDIKHIKTFYKQIPNILTFTRLIGAIPAGLMFYFGNPYIALGLIGLLWGTDAIDGQIARKYKIESKLGADMDAIADKAMFLGSAIPLITTSPMLLLTFFLEGVISAINVSGRAKGLDTKTVMSGKKKTIALALTLIAGYLVKFLSMPSIILSILMGVTAIFQGIAIKDYIKEYRRMNDIQKNGKKVEEEKTKDLDLQKDKTKEETLSKENKKTLLDRLRKAKEFLLSTREPDKVSKPKTKTKEKN